MTRWLDAQLVKKAIVDVIRLIGRCHCVPMNVVRVSFICWLFYKVSKNTSMSLNKGKPVLKHCRWREKLELAPQVVVAGAEHERPVQATAQNNASAHSVTENRNSSDEIIECESQEVVEKGKEEEEQLRYAVAQIHIVVERVLQNRSCTKYKVLHDVYGLAPDESQGNERLTQTTSQNILAQCVAETHVSISTSRRGSEALEFGPHESVIGTEQSECPSEAVTNINILLESGSQTSGNVRSAASSDVLESESWESIDGTEGEEHPSRTTSLENVLQGGAEIYRSISSTKSSEPPRHDLQDVVKGTREDEDISKDLAQDDVTVPNVFKDHKGKNIKGGCERRNSESGGIVEPEDTKRLSGWGDLPDIALHGRLNLSPSGNIADPSILLGLAQVELKKEHSLTCALRRRVVQLEEQIESQESALLSCEMENVALEERLRDAEDMLRSSQEEANDLRRELEASRVVSDMKESFLLVVMDELQDAVLELDREMSFKEDLEEAFRAQEEEEKEAFEIEDSLRSFCFQDE